MHVYSTLFEANTIVNDLRTEADIDKAIAWCKDLRLHKVYLESFRYGVFVEQERLVYLRDRFQAAGFTVHGCVTTNGLPRTSNNWNLCSCYTDPATREMMTQIFRRTASVFDVVMIDDFLFTDCTCELCDAARGQRSFADYHSDLMHEMSVENILGPAHAVNPGCKVIIKYPQWYEDFHRKGYDTIRQTRDFDLIWAGTELREPDSALWGRYPQTQAFYLMAWAKKLGDEKCRGGWFDSYTCRPATYLDQARQTVLAQAGESMLYSYNCLTEQKEIADVGYDAYTPGKEDTLALRRERDALDKLAYLLEGKKTVGVSVPKQPDRDAPVERYLSSFYGMLGIPVAPAVVLEEAAPAVILGAQAAVYHGVRDYLFRLKGKGARVVCTRGFEQLTGYRSEPGVPVIDIKSTGLEPDTHCDPDDWNLVAMPEAERDALRDYLMEPLGVHLRGPARVALNLYDDNLEVVQNFNDHEVEVTLDLSGRDRKTRKIMLVLSEDQQASMTRDGAVYTIRIPARTYVVLA